jgi:hypothetical protein
MSNIRQALEEGSATIPQITEYVLSVTERLKTDTEADEKIDFDERSIGDLFKAAKDLWDAVDELHGKHFLANMTM